MIELNKKTEQDFLNRKWVQNLLDAGVDMSDAKYCLYHPNEGGGDYITDIKVIRKIEEEEKENARWDYVPTYTVSELLYKLHEYIYPTIDGREYSGGLRFIKDAPSYIFYYDLVAKPDEEGYVPVTKERNDRYISASLEYPIESLASLLIPSHKKDIGLTFKDTGDISEK